MNNTGSERTGLLSGTTQDRPAVAATIMVGSLFLLGFQDALVKTTSSEVSLWQFNLVRGAFNFLLLLTLMRVILGKGNPRPLKPWSVLLRSLLQIATMCCFFGGVPFLSLAEIAAGLYVYPLFVAVLSAVVLGGLYFAFHYIVWGRRLSRQIAEDVKSTGASPSPVSSSPVPSEPPDADLHESP